MERSTSAGGRAGRSELSLSLALVLFAWACHGMGSRLARDPIKPEDWLERGAEGLALTILGAGAQGQVDAALARLLEEPSLELGKALADRLARLDEAAVLRYLAPHSRSGADESRRAALLLMRGIGGGAAADALLDAALRTGCPDREEILAELAAFDRPRVLLALVRGLEPEAAVSTRVNAAFALGTLGATEVAATLERLALDKEEVPFLRRSALVSLGRLLAPDGFDLVLAGLLARPEEPLLDYLVEQVRSRPSSWPKAHEALAKLRPAEAPTALAKGPVHELIVAHARRHALDPRLVAAVIKVESDFERKAVSSSGAQGLMQLMPQTAAELGVGDPFDPAQNIAGGTRYLRQMLDRFGRLELALAAYNAGPRAVEKHRGIPPFAETQRYVQKVMSAYREMATLPLKLLGQVG